MSVSETIIALTGNAYFRSFFTSLLSDSPFSGFRWETPAITLDRLNTPFEFVLVNTPWFCDRQSDPDTFSRYFTNKSDYKGIITFPNLGRDAHLIAPSPRSSHTHYGHLASFIRGAQAEQVDALWQVTGLALQQQVNDKPLWMNTAGGGVAWLHIRLDTSPKYYVYEKYKNAAYTA